MIPILREALTLRRWAIRNCGLMLFKALLVRLAGGQSVSTKNQRRTRSSKMIYEKFPSLAHIVVRLLQMGNSLPASQTSSRFSSIEEATTRLVEVIYPAMEIIEKIGMPSSSREDIIPLLVLQLESPIFGVREKAAGILCHELEGYMLTEDIEWLLEPPWAPQNALHGWLLCLKFKIAHLGPRYRGKTGKLLCLARWQADILDNESITLSWLLSLYDSLVGLNPCPITAATYLEALDLYLKQTIRDNCKCNLKSR